MEGFREGIPDVLPEGAERSAAVVLGLGPARFAREIEFVREASHSLLDESATVYCLIELEEAK